MDRRIPFSKEDEEKIASAALWGMIAAITSIVSAAIGLVIVLSTAATGKNMLTQLITVGITSMLGVWLYQASVAFRKVALTDVADQHYLMEGFQKLRAYFMTIGVLIIIGLCLFGLLFLGAMMCGGMRF